MFLSEIYNNNYIFIHFPYLLLQDRVIKIW